MRPKAECEVDPAFGGILRYLKCAQAAREGVSVTVEVNVLLNYLMRVNNA